MRVWILACLIACGPSTRESLVDGAADSTSTADAVSSDACAAAAAQKSYIGCTYWPVDLANAIEVMGPPQGTDCSMYGASAVMMMNIDACVNTDGTFAGRCDPGGTCPTGATCETRAACGLDAQHSPFAIVVANVGSEPAELLLVDGTGMMATATVAPGGTETLSPQALGFVDHSIDAPGITRSAYRLQSSRPVVAYQLNPLDDVGVFSNDGTLLLPEQTFDASYVALSYPNNVRRPQSSDWRGYLTLVAIDETRVEITAATDVLAGTTTIAAGQTATLVLKTFDVLQLTAASGDISGTRVTSDRALGAYAGHEAAVIQDPFPFRGPCCADHLEEQLYPTRTWGKVYAIGRGRERATQIHDYVRIVAQRPNTVVQLTPASAVYTTCGNLLAAGQTCDAYLSADVEVHANEPVLVGHYMVSGGGVGPQSGDPSLAFVPPIDQFRKTYTVVVPKQYDANDLTLVAPTGGTITLDEADVSLLFTPFASQMWSAARIAITPGAHTIACSLGCSVEVSGWDTAVSYLYSGGLDLAPIVQ